jgi:thiamine monophosphate synthase
MSTNERVMHTSNDDDYEFKTAIEKMDQLRALCDEEDEILVIKPKKRLNDDFKTAIEKMDQLRALCNEEEIIVFKNGNLP